MIHVIYIYFIINAFIAGIIYQDGNDWRGAIVCFFIGVPTSLYVCFLMFFKWIANLTIIKGYYNLYFTDYFSDLDERTINMRRSQYFGQAKTIKNANWHERFFLRQIDKKYNYGITKGEPKP